MNVLTFICHVLPPPTPNREPLNSISVADFLPGDFGFSLWKAELPEEWLLKGAQFILSSLDPTKRVNIKPNVDKTAVGFSFPLFPKGVFALSKTRNTLFKVFLVQGLGCQESREHLVVVVGFSPNVTSA